MHISANYRGKSGTVLSPIAKRVNDTFTPALECTVTLQTRLQKYVRGDDITMENMWNLILEVENMWKRISSMPDSYSKVAEVLKFAHDRPQWGYWWTIAMNEYNRLYNLGYWKWQDERKQNG